MAAFWTIAGLMILLVAGIMAAAVVRPRGRLRAAELDMALYRDQLAEVDRDVARGVLSEADAAPVRLEVSRRLLEANRRLSGPADARRGGGWIAAGITGLVILAAGPLVYLQLGAPRYPDLALQDRLEAARDYRETRISQAEAETQIGYSEPNPANPPEQLALLAELRSVLAGRPDDLTGHEMLAGFEAQLGHYRGAYQALDQVIALKGAAAAAADWADYADLLVLAAGGYVSPEAERAASKALAMEPENSVAGYYLGLMWAQTGRPDLAFATWKTLLDRLGPEDPVRPPVEAQIAIAAEQAGIRYSPPEPALRGPSAGDVAAASEMSEADRQSMIEAMVAGLMDRLASEGGSAAEWARLIRALGVLGRTEEAQAIAAEARTVFAADTAGLAAVEDAAASLEAPE